MTAATVDVLRVLVGAGGPVWGLRVIKDAGRPAGTVYPALDRLEQSGWVRSWWAVDEERPGPRRRYYELTTEGALAATRVISTFDMKRSGTRLRPTGEGL